MAEAPRSVAINTTALALVVALATTIGIAPYAVLVGAPWILPIAAAGALIVGILVARRLKTGTRQAPGRLEFLVGATGAMAGPAMVSLAGITSYWLIYHSVRLAKWVAGQFEMQFAIDGVGIAFGVSLFFVAIMALANVAPSTLKLTRQLYPRTAGLRSVFFSLVVFRRWRALVYLAAGATVVGAGVGLALLVPSVRAAWWFSLGLAWALVLVAAPVFELSEEPKESAESEKAIEAVKELFQAAGYRVLNQPRTGEEDLDPLLVGTPDLYAEDSERALAVKVKTARETEESESRGLSDLSSAVWALNSYLEREAEGERTPVDPVLALVGLDPSPEVRIYEKKGLLRVLQIAPEALERLRGTADEDERQAIARDQIHFPGRDGPASSTA